jgi:large subunit ribosomal protein L10
MATAKKVAVVAELTELLGRAQIVISTDYRGASVAQMAALRRSLKTQDVDVKVVKNRLALRAAAAVDHPELAEILSGPTAIAIGYGDPVGPAKALTSYISGQRNFPVEIIGGWVAGRVLDRAGIEEFAKIPSKDELISMIAGQLQSPLRTFAGLIQASMREFTGLVDARAGQLEEAA